MKYSFIIILLLLCYSCQKVEFFDYTEKELVDVKKFLRKKDFKHHSQGTYLFHHDTIISNYLLDKKYTLEIIKFNNLTDTRKVDINANIPYESINSAFTNIEDTQYDLNYNLYGFSKVKEINSLHFSSDGEISRIYSNDTIQVYHTAYEHLVFYPNNQKDTRIIIKNTNFSKQQLKSDFAFYRKDNDIYFLLLTSTTPEDVKAGTLLNYLNL
ncbi:hypothetical protein [Flavobacterium psychrotrophum]|uniref:hypothetical protein n=1 Tax=Flavobacterium psychrotrophum TaxID=2294119 RepID=UPI000E31E2DE|nr:hypothetical protein [Flavobacterium psychrotrophum]